MTTKQTTIKSTPNKPQSTRSRKPRLTQTPTVSPAKGSNLIDPKMTESGQETTSTANDTMDVDKATETTPTDVTQTDGNDDEELQVTGVSKPATRKRKDDGENEWQLVIDNKKYRKVNTMSENRRESRKERDSRTASNPSGRDDTPNRGRNSSANFNYKTRITVKMNVPNNPDDRYGPVLNAIQELLQQLDNADEGIALLPWKKRNWDKPNIHKPSNFPTDWDVLKDYVHSKFWMPVKSTQTADIYPNFYIGHNRTFNDIKDRMGNWLTSKRSIYRNLLQVEDPSEVGFFLYSTREMDAGALADDIEDALGFSVGLRWKVIDNGKRNLQKNDQVRALIVEVDATKRYELQRKLMKFYNSTKKDVTQYPNGIRMRFVMSIRDALNTNQKSKIEKLRRRQRDFLTTIRTSTSYSIYDIDYYADDTLPTLRQMIMSIKVNGKPKVPLFHSVDLDYQGRGHTFQYSNDVAAEAECAVNTLIPYLQYYFPKIEDTIGNYFDDEAIARCEDLKFDPARGMVVDRDDTIGHFEIEFGDDLEGFNFNTTEDAVETTDDTQRPRKKTTGPADDDSVSTFAGKTVTTSKTRASVANVVSPARDTTTINNTTNQMDNDEVSMMSAGTTLTMNTIKTLREDTDRKFETLSGETATIKTQLAEMMQMLRMQQGPDSNIKAGSPVESQQNAGGGEGSASGKGPQ